MEFYSLGKDVFVFFIKERSNAKSGFDEGENIGKITSPHLNPLPQGERKIGLMKSAPNLFFKVWLGVVLLIMVIIFLPVQVVQAAVEGVSSIATSGAWDDGAGAYSAGNYSVPAGFSAPVMPSFSSNSITPTYYFDRQMRVNSAGFTTMGGSFTNPAAIAFTSLPNSQERHGIPVWFHNGLDGITFHHQSAFASRIDQSFIKGLGLDKVTPVGQRQIYYSDGTHLQTRDVYKTGIGLQIDYAVVQSQAFINENLQNMKEGNHSTISERRDPNDALSNAAAQVNYYSLGKGNVLMAINKPEDFFHWNYSSGAYVQPGDVLYYEGNQRIEGFGTTKDFQQLNYTVHNITGRGVAVVAPSGNLLSIEGRVKNIPIQNSLNPAQAMPVTAEVSFRNGVIEPNYYKERNQTEDFNPEVVQLNSGISRDSLNNPLIGQGMEIADLNSGEEIYKDSDLEISEDEIKRINQAGWPAYIDLRKGRQIMIALKGLGSGIWNEDIDKQLNEIVGKAKKERVEGVLCEESISRDNKKILGLDLNRASDLQVYKEIMKVFGSSGEIVAKPEISLESSIGNTLEKILHFLYMVPREEGSLCIDELDLKDKARQELRGAISSLVAAGWEREVIIDTMADLLIEKKMPVGRILHLLEGKVYVDNLAEQILEKSSHPSQIKEVTKYFHDALPQGPGSTFKGEDIRNLKAYLAGYDKNLGDNIKELAQLRNSSIDDDNAVLEQVDDLRRVIKGIDPFSEWASIAKGSVNKSFKISESLYQEIAPSLRPSELLGFINTWGAQAKRGLSPQNEEQMYSNLEDGLSRVIGRPVNRETAESLISFSMNIGNRDIVAREPGAVEIYSLLGEMCQVE